MAEVTYLEGLERKLCLYRVCHASMIPGTHIKRKLVDMVAYTYNSSAGQMEENGCLDLTGHPA